MIGNEKIAQMHRFRKVNLMNNKELLSRLGQEMPQNFSDDKSSVLDPNKTHSLSNFDSINNKNLNLEENEE